MDSNRERRDVVSTRNDWRVCCSVLTKFLQLASVEESSPCHRGWSHSWQARELTKIALWRVLLLQVHRVGGPWLLSLPPHTTLPAPYTRPDPQGAPSPERESRETHSISAFHSERRSVNAFIKYIASGQSGFLFLGQKKRKLMSIQFTKQYKC